MERMERALHPGLPKRSVLPDPCSSRGVQEKSHEHNSSNDGDACLIGRPPVG